MIQARWTAARLQPALLFVLMLVCWTPGSAAAVREDAAPLRIVLDRKSCAFGDCPDYRLTIEGSGLVTFEGRHGVNVRGTVRTRIDPARVAALAGRFRAANFHRLRDAYRTEASDGATYRLTFAEGARVKTVVDYYGDQAGMPAVVTQLQRQVDEAGGAQRWIEGDEATVPQLRAQGWDFGSPDSAAMLGRAAATGNAVMVRDLLAAGVPATGRHLGTTAIEAAARSRSFETWRHLASAGALEPPDPGFRQRIAMIAAGAGSLEILQAMMPLGIDVNAGPDTLLATAMAFECEEGPQCPTLALMRFLLAAGADPNRADELGNRALHYAENVDEARILIEARATVNALNNQGETPAQGMYQGWETLVLYLLDAGTDPSIRDIHGQTLADKARANGWSRVLARLSGQP